MWKNRGEDVYSRLMKYTPYEDPNWERKVAINFGYAVAGWISLWISNTAFLQNISIHLSNYDDPFEELEKWLEAICSGQSTGQFCIDEEGTVVTLRFIRLGPDLLDFQVVDGYGEHDRERDILIRCRVSAKQLVQEFIFKLDLFIHHYYDWDEWLIEEFDFKKFDSYLNPDDEHLSPSAPSTE